MNYKELAQGAEQARVDLWRALESIDRGDDAQGFAFIGTVIEWVTNVSKAAERRVSREDVE